MYGTVNYYLIFYEFSFLYLFFVFIKINFISTYLNTFMYFTNTNSKQNVLDITGQVNI